MKRSLPYFRDFPKDFQTSAMNQVLKAVNRRENLQIIGLKGSGKSLILRAIDSGLPKFKKIDVFYFDIGLLPDLSGKTMLKMIEEGLAELNGKKRAIFLFDSFENVIEAGDKSVIKVLNSVYDANRDYLTMIFSVERPIESGDRLFGRTYYVEPLKGNDLKWFVEGLEIVWKKKLDKKILEKIVKTSGGYMAIIKRLVEAAMEGEEIDRIIEDPKLNPHLLYQLELMKEGLQGRQNNFEVPILNTFVLGKNRERKDEDFGYIKVNTRLTKYEYKVLKNLFNHPNSIVSREDSVLAIWGENAVGIAEHALDQIIYRLNKKLEKSKSGVEIETVRGRGHALIRH